MNHRRTLASLLAAALIAALVAACAADSPPTDVVSSGPDVAAEADAAPARFVPSTADRLVPGPFAVGFTTITFIDPNRSTPPNGDAPGAESRTLVTEIWYPRVDDGSDTPTRDARGLAAQGPFPRIIHSHGFMSGRLDSPGLARFLASHGYVVAAPDFPLSHRLAPGGPNVVDAAEQPVDVRFIAGALLEMSDGDGVLANLMDGHGLAFTGVSLGAYTAVMAGLDPLLPGERPDAFVSLATAACFLEPRVFETQVPALFIHGDADAILPYALHALPVYELTASPKWLMTLHRGTHTGCVDITSGLMADLDHADVIGCEALSRTLPSEEDGDWPVSQDMDFMEEACVAPCSDPDLLVDGMDTLRQRDLIHATVLAFLDGQLRGDPEAMAFIEVGVGDENDDVSVTHDP